MSLRPMTSLTSSGSGRSETTEAFDSLLSDCLSLECSGLIPTFGRKPSCRFLQHQLLPE